MQNFLSINNNKLVAYGIILFFVFCVVFLLFGETLSANLLASLPFEKQYEPNLLTYILHGLPLVYIFFICKGNSHNSIQELVYIAFINLIIGLALSSLFFDIQYIYSYLYLIIYLPIVSTFYYSLACFIKRTTEFNDIPKSTEENKETGDVLRILLLCMFILLILFLNVIPLQLSAYPVGSDIYYHLAVAKNMVFSNPYFIEEGTIPYTKLGYYLLYTLHLTLGLDRNIIGLLIIPLGSLLFILLYCSVLNELKVNKRTSFLSILFLFPLWQILFTDPSIRIFSYALFLCMVLLLLQGKKVVSILLVGIIALFHPEIGIHALLVQLFYFILPYGLQWKNKMFSKGSDIGDLHHESKLYKIIIVATLIILNIPLWILANEINFGLIFRNDIPLSITAPVGVISFFAILGYFGFVIQNRFNKKLLVIFAVTLLFTNILFFYSKWRLFYHRYFVETAYIGMCIFASLFYGSLFKQGTRKIFTVMMIIICLFSVYPRFHTIIKNSTNIHTYVEDKEVVFAMLQEQGLSHKVIAVHYNDYIIRYIPYFTDNYVFGGNFHTSDNQEFNIIPICGGFDMRKTCASRLQMLKNLFDNPSLDSLSQMKEFRLDYILLHTKQQDTFLQTDLSNKMIYIASAGDYALYEVQY